MKAKKIVVIQGCKECPHRITSCFPPICELTNSETFSINVFTEVNKDCPLEDYPQNKVKAG
jgi:hypothetical protein